MLKIRLVCATRRSADDFHANAALGRSLRLAFGDLDCLELVLFPENRQGLPAVYNQAIRDAVDRPAVLLFIHDDVHLVDFFWPDRLYLSLEQFQIVGIVGNSRRLPRQPSWFFKDEWFTPDSFEHLSGLICHGTEFPARITRFGRMGPCQLLDGVFLAAESETLNRHRLRFDERFDFHCYDLDFCRQAAADGVSMGTVPISVMHESSGHLRTEGWNDAFRKYLDKWGD